MTADDFVQNRMLKIENKLFWGHLLARSIGYLLITLLLNSIRTSIPSWFLWILIIIQFVLYFSIFFVSFQRALVFGINKNLALIIFIIFAILGRVNDWEILILPVLVVVMLVLSTKNKKLPEESKKLLSTD